MWFHRSIESTMTNVRCERMCATTISDAFIGRALYRGSSTSNSGESVTSRILAAIIVTIRYRRPGSIIKSKEREAWPRVNTKVHAQLDRAAVQILAAIELEP